MAGYDVKPFNVGSINGFAHISLVDDTLIDRAVHLLDVHTQSAAGVGLRVGIHHEYGLFKSSQRRGQIDGCRGLAHTAFLIS